MLLEHNPNSRILKGVGAVPYVHRGVDLCYSLIIQWELVDLDPVADQFAHDFDLELVQFALTDGVCFGDHWDDVDLKRHTDNCICKPHN